MNCSTCGYEFTMREIQTAQPCPKCEQEKAAAARAEQVRQERPMVAAAVAPHVKKVMDQYRGAQPVVIMDVNMSFNSMVWFMVKWVIASIPAFIILVLIFFMVSAFFGGFLGALSR